jgi:hypothetical protein
MSVRRHLLRSLIVGTLVVGCHEAAPPTPLDVTQPNDASSPFRDNPSGRDAGTDAAPAATAPAPQPPPQEPPAPSGCPSGAFFCDSFEGAGLDASKWGVSGSEHFVLDDAVMARGSKSLRMRFGPKTGQGDALLPTLNAFTHINGELFVRFFLRFDDLAFPGFHPSYVTLAAQAGSPFSDPQIGLGYIRGELGMFYFPADEWGMWPAPNIAAREWKCIEMHFQRSDAGESLHVSVDGAEVPDMGRTGSLWPVPKCTGDCFLEGAHLQLGVSSLGPCDETSAGCDDAPITMWVDELVVSRTAVGCSP